jgi:cobalamin biosynthesis protein CobD/CbiB
LIAIHNEIRGVAVNDMGWGILAFIVMAAMVAATAVALDIWLDVVGRRNRYRDRLADERAAHSKKAPTLRHRRHAWIVLACTVVGIATLFVIAENAVTAVREEHFRSG